MTSEKARRYLRSLPRRPGVDFSELYPDADPRVRVFSSLWGCLWLCP